MKPLRADDPSTEELGTTESTIVKLPVVSGGNTWAEDEMGVEENGCCVLERAARVVLTCVEGCRVEKIPDGAVLTLEDETVLKGGATTEPLVLKIEVKVAIGDGKTMDVTSTNVDD